MKGLGALSLFSKDNTLWDVHMTHLSRRGGRALHACFGCCQYFMYKSESSVHLQQVDGDRCAMQETFTSAPAEGVDTEHTH